MLLVLVLVLMLVMYIGVSPAPAPARGSRAAPAPWAKSPRRLKVVLTRSEVLSVLTAADKDDDRLILQLLYGTSMRLREGLRLRVKDLDFDYNQITVRDGKGFKDRVTMLPELVKPRLTERLEGVRSLHQQDLAQGCGRVHLPYALARKYLQRLRRNRRVLHAQQQSDKTPSAQRRG